MDEAKREAFAGQMLSIVNDAGLAIMCSLGHRTGLFDAMSAMEAATSEEIAEQAQLNERYVREWLGGMTVGGIVEHDGVAGTFWLPPEHAAFLTRAAGPDNLAMQGQYLAMFGAVEDEIVECFRSGGGVPYDRYPRFQALMAAESAMSFDLALVDGVLPLVPGLTDRLRNGIEVADVGCGQGHAINVMARAFPNSRFTGLDLSPEAIDAAWTETKELGLSNTAFEVRDIATLAGAFDLVTGFDIVHDQARPREVLQAIRGSLRPGGTFLCADVAMQSAVEDNIGHPLGPWFYTFSLMHCMTVSLALEGEGLGTAWGEQTARRYFEEAGFHVAAAEHVEGDPVNVFFVLTPDSA
jgi:2-polyprenyl-3-methyl-5-hydroxy-6-metoxy-1,4-benzoquinol methylase